MHLTQDRTPEEDGRPQHEGGVQAHCCPHLTHSSQRTLWLVAEKKGGRESRRGQRGGEGTGDLCLSAFLIDRGNSAPAC